MSVNSRELTAEKEKGRTLGARPNPARVFLSYYAIVISGAR